MASWPEGTRGVRLYRLLKQKYARQALAGRGGLEADGRWHSAGRPIVYLASSEALAVLEVRVHLGSVVPVDPYALLTIELPGRLIDALGREQWPRGWDAVPFGPASQRVGDRWLAEARGVALRVPSVHSSSDFNVLFNPAHAAASRARIVGRRRYAFDVRLF
jgi:RES domain-containing protein